jgi:Carboxypeptidase regulatory-like domain
MEEHMKQRWHKLLLFSLLVVLAGVSVTNAGPGKISGVVNDSDGQPLAGSNVTVLETALGAAADASGRYFILNVPPGTYRVRASAVGFAPQVITDVRVASDQTVTIDFSLRAEAVGLEEVLVTAEVPLVDRTRIATKTTFSRDDVSNLPVSTVYDVINTSASVYNGFVRGGRYVETRTLVDGVDITDPYAAIDADARGISNVQVTYSGVVRPNDRHNVQAGLAVDAIEEASLNTGAVGAEYTSATAGVINIALKEGRGPLSGRLFVRTSPGGLKHAGPAVYQDQGKYAAEKAGSTAPEKYTWSDGKLGDDGYGYDPSSPGSTRPTTDIELSLNGGVTEDLGLYFAGKFFNSYGSYPGEFYREVDLSLKATYQVTPKIKTTFLGLVRDRGKLFGWKNRSFNDIYRYLLEGVPMSDGAGITAGLKFTHLLSSTTFYDLQVSQVYNENRLGYVDGDGDGIIRFAEDGDFLTFDTEAQKTKYLDKFFSSGPKNGPDLTGFGSPPYQLSGPGIYYERTRINTWTVKGDLTSQVTFNHQLKAGGQARFHLINSTKRSSPVGYIEEKFKVTPSEFGIYVQDRMEYAGLILNVGVRADALSYNEAEFANFFAPAEKDPNPPFGISRSIAVRGDKPDMKWYFTPKIGVSHPISEYGAVYFSFSRQMTPQPFGNVFAAYNLYGTSPILPSAARIDQDPFVSTNYELGAQWVFVEDFSLDINAYFRNIENYGLDNAVVVWRAPSGVPNLYNVQFSGGYADARGVEVTLTKRPTRLFDFMELSGRASYALSYVKASSGPLGSAIDKEDVTQFSTAGGDSARYLGSLPFGDYQFYNRIQQDVIGVNSTLTGGYDRTHRINLYMFFNFDYDIRLSLLGKFASGFFYTLQFAEPRSREQGTSPWTKQVDLRIEKGFPIGTTRLSVFVEVKNLLESENILTYFQSPDGKGQEIWEKNGIPSGPDNRSTTLDGSAIYDIARQIYLGASFEF